MKAKETTSARTTKPRPRSTRVRPRLSDPEIALMQRTAYRAVDKLADTWESEGLPKRYKGRRLEAALHAFWMLAQARSHRRGIL